MARTAKVNPEALRKAVQQGMRAKGMDDHELAAVAQVSVNTVGNILREARDGYWESTLVKVASALGYDVDALIDLQDSDDVPVPLGRRVESLEQETVRLRGDVRRLSGLLETLLARQEQTETEPESGGPPSV